MFYFVHLGKLSLRQKRALLIELFFTLLVITVILRDEESAQIK